MLRNPVHDKTCGGIFLDLRSAAQGSAADPLNHLFHFRNSVSAMLSKGFLTIGLLIISNVFMTLAWYLHLKLQAAKVISFWPVWAVVLFSWSIALFEYSFQVPANRIGFDGNGGPFSLLELKVIQEVITLTVFTLFSMLLFGLKLQWNHLAAFSCLVMAVWFTFQKP